MLTALRLAILLAMVTKFAFADTCPNRNYCHSAEAKYRAFHKLPDSYLNSTDKIMKTFPANTSRKCMQECTRTEFCQSANHYQQGNASEMSCDLLTTNKWSNTTLLVKRGNSTHYFIMNSCASIPCKHGGTCISLDQEASYKCACAHINYTTTIHGPNCEIVKLAEETSDIYYRFDTATPKNLQKTGNSFYKYSKVKLLNVPDRKKTSSVVYLPGESGQYAYISGFGSGCPMRIDNCPAGLTVSIWFRLLERSQKRFNPSSCSSVKNVLVKSKTSNQGFKVIVTGCTQNAMIVMVSSYTQSWEVKWGNASDKTWSTKWSNFVFTHLTSEGIVLYFNGEEVKKVTSYSSHSSTTSYGSYIYLGDESTGNMEVYIDDFTAWFKRLTSADVLFSYKRRLQLDYSG